MQRRNFLKLIGVISVAPTVVIPKAKPFNWREEMLKDFPNNETPFIPKVTKLEPVYRTQESINFLMECEYKNTYGVYTGRYKTTHGIIHFIQHPELREKI